MDLVTAIAYLSVIIRLYAFGTSCDGIKHLTKIPASNINSTLVAEFLRNLTCSSSDTFPSFKECVAVCMSLDQCVAIQYDAFCDICTPANVRNAGYIDLHGWFIDLESVENAFGKLFVFYCMNCI